MKRMFRVFAVSLLLSLSVSSFAQVDQRDQWMNKYWFYRNRLINDYMIVGEGQGMSLPAIRRCSVGFPNYWGNFVPDEGTSGSWGFRVPSAGDSGTISWGADGPINLGWYIAVLASEWGCISAYLGSGSGGNNLAQTGMELKYALEALERLDAKGENYENALVDMVPSLDVWSDIGDQLNGFFIRDDVPWNFIDPKPANPRGNPNGYANWQKLNSKKTLSHSDNTKYTYVSTIDGGFQSVQHDRIGYTNQPLDPSKDQYASIFMGLAMVCKFCGDGDNYGGYYFKTHAQDEMNRIIGFFNSQPNRYSLGKYPDIPGYCWRDYDLGPTNLGTGYCDDLGVGFYCVAKKWSNVVPQAPPSNASEDWILLQNYGFANMARTMAYSLNSNNGIFSYMPAMLAACGNALDDELFPGYSSGNYKPDDHDQINSQILKAYGRNYDDQMMPLMHSLMFAADNGMNMSEFSDILNEAPCYGPSNFGAQNVTYGGSQPVPYTVDFPASRTALFSYQDGWDSYQWSSTNCWISHDRRGMDDANTWDFVVPSDPAVFGDLAGQTGSNFPTGNGFNGEYNGLDYMLFYNLYIFNYGSSQCPMTGYQNELTNHLNGTYPETLPGSIAVGNSSSNIKRNIGMININSTEHIESGGYVYDQAGEEIDLNPGFSADAGSSYEAKIQYLSDCISDGNSYEAPDKNNKTANTASNPPDSNSKEVAANIVSKDSNATAKPQLNIVGVYPNPFNSDVNVVIKTPNDKPFDLQVTNMLGQTIDHRSLSSNGANIPVSVTLHYYEIAAGCYTVTAKNSESITSKRIIKY